MAITAAMVKELREATGVGMTDCKKALAENNGNMEEAIEYLRKKGLAAAEKKAGRIAAEGLVAFAYQNNDTEAAIVEVNSETDFVAKNAAFITYVNEVAGQALNTSAKDVESFLNEQWEKDTSKTVAEELSSKIAVIGEKLSIRRFEQLKTDKGCIAGYSHNGGKIGVLVELEASLVNDNVKEMGKNIAMQIAAMKPKYISQAEISDDFKEKERDILKEAAKNEHPDKADKIIDGMVNGRLNKRFKEICLLDQAYIRDDKTSVGQYVKNVAEAEGSEITVKSFVRYETGEGLEKKEENFAEEVAKQMS